MGLKIGVKLGDFVIGEIFEVRARDLAHAERTKMHGLMLEALDLLFKQRGSRSIEQLVKAQSR